MLLDALGCPRTLRDAPRRFRMLQDAAGPDASGCSRTLRDALRRSRTLQGTLRGAPGCSRMLDAPDMLPANVPQMFRKCSANVPQMF